MQFNSIDFMIFFPIVVAIYFVIPRKARMPWLLVASYYFYMSWNPKYAVLIAGSTALTYLTGLRIDRLRKKNENSKGRQKLAMVVCILLNLGILGLFKYGNFALESLSSLLSAVGIGTIDRRFDFLLPVGISFYTFQALGYIIDVYRGDVEVEKNPLRYALFVSFFPQLVAGPIERSKNLLTQMQNMEKIKVWNARRVTSGAILMVWGLFLKMVISDRVSIFVDNVYDDFAMYGSVELILATLGFTIQIYCDFSSYSLIAIGAAKVMGFDLMENFNTPYFSRSIAEFWRRWHISLSTWFRDYLYIPLGGNRKGKARKYLNVMIVFLVSGLWHGANWTYVVWGGIHGLYQVIGQVLTPARNWLWDHLGVNRELSSWKLLQMMGTFLLAAFAWIFFRAESLSDAVAIVGRIFTRQDPWVLHDGSLLNIGLSGTEWNILLVALVMLLLVDLIHYKKQMTLDAYLMGQNLWFEWAVVILLIVMIFVFGEYGPAYDAKQFIYFQF